MSRNTRRHTSRPAPARRAAPALALLGVVALGMAAPPPPEEIARRAAEQFRTGDFAGAVADYELLTREHGETPQRLYNLATALAASGERSRAEPLLRRADELAADPSLRARARYNLAQSLFTTASAIVQEDPEQALGLFRRSAEAARAAWRLDPADQDAARHVEVARLAEKLVRDQLELHDRLQQAASEQRRQARNTRERVQARQPQPSAEPPQSSDDPDAQPQEGPPESDARAEGRGREGEPIEALPPSPQGLMPPGQSGGEPQEQARPEPGQSPRSEPAPDAPPSEEAAPAQRGEEAQRSGEGEGEAPEPPQAPPPQDRQGPPPPDEDGPVTPGPGGGEPESEQQSLNQRTESLRDTLQRAIEHDLNVGDRDMVQALLDAIEAARNQQDQATDHLHQQRDADAAPRQEAAAELLELAEQMAQQMGQELPQDEQGEGDGASSGGDFAGDPVARELLDKEQREREMLNRYRRRIMQRPLGVERDW